MASSPGSAFITPALLYVYLFFVAMPIVNLLIAMFSEVRSPAVSRLLPPSPAFSDLLWPSPASSPCSRRRSPTCRPRTPRSSSSCRHVPPLPQQPRRSPFLTLPWPHPSHHPLQAVGQCLNYLNAYYPAPIPLNLAVLPLDMLGRTLAKLVECCCKCSRGSGTNRVHPEPALPPAAAAAAPAAASSTKGGSTGESPRGGGGGSPRDAPVPPTPRASLRRWKVMCMACSNMHPMRDCTCASS